MAPDAKKIILDFLDGKQYAVPLPALILGLQDQIGADEVKTATRELYEECRLCRAPVQKADGSFFFIFWSIYFKISGNAAVAESPEPSKEEVRQTLTTEEALAILEKAGWKPEPEVRIERQVVFSESWTALDVIDRWKLSYRLSRIIEILGGSKRKGLSHEEAKEIGKLARQHAEQTNQPKE